MSNHDSFDRDQQGRHAPFVTPKPKREVNDELEFHLEQRIQSYIASGMAPDAARRKALERFGDVEGVREECEQLLTEDRKAEARRDWFDDLRQDLRFAVRSAVKTPLFSLLAIVTLALGIGANAAVFGVVKSVLLDALPYTDADRLVRIYSHWSNAPGEAQSVSPGVATDLATRLRSFSSVAPFNFS